MEAKDISLFTGIGVTLLLGIGNLIYNILLSRRTAFINAVTSERVKWIGNLRENISKFVGLNHHWFVLRHDIDNAQKDEMTRDLRVLRYYIKLQLNPKSDAIIDQKIMTLVDDIADKAAQYKIQQLTEKLDDLVSESQQLLKAEWDKVKREAQRGPLADNATLWENAKRLMWG
jgi:hypothetical protein